MRSLLKWALMPAVMVGALAIGGSEEARADYGYGGHGYHGHHDHGHHGYHGGGYGGGYRGGYGGGYGYHDHGYRPPVTVYRHYAPPVPRGPSFHLQFSSPGFYGGYRSYRPAPCSPYGW